MVSRPSVALLGCIVLWSSPARAGSSGSPPARHEDASGDTSPLDRAVRADAGRAAEAMEDFDAALRLDPGSAAAIADFETESRLAPDEASPRTERDALKARLAAVPAPASSAAASPEGAK